MPRVERLVIAGFVMLGKNASDLVQASKRHGSVTPCAKHKACDPQLRALEKVKRYNLGTLSR
jgi:hypothetical protein